MNINLKLLSSLKQSAFACIDIVNQIEELDWYKLTNQEKLHTFERIFNIAVNITDEQKTTVRKLHETAFTEDTDDDQDDGEGSDNCD